MSALPNETDSAVDPGVLLATTSDPPFNLTPAHRAEIVSEQPVAPLCSICCCGFVNRTFAVVFMVSLVFAIVVGNVITLIVFVQTRQSRTPQGYLKVSLAIADMMGSSASLSGQRNRWQPCMLIGPVFAGCTFVSISTIFLMTVERSVAILWPLHKDALVTRRRTLLLILLSWAASFLLALAPLVFSSNFTLEYNECSRMCNYSPVLLGNRLPRDANILLLFPVFDFTLLGGTLAINIMSFTSIRQYSRRRKLLSAGNLTDGEGGTGAGVGSCPHRPSFSDIKAAKTISILTFAFTASFSPIAVFVLGNVVGYTWCNFSFVAFWILTANSCCNVIIYSVRDHRFRKGVALLFQRDHCPPQEEKT
ncbi:alpha-1A adrenergic receptor-like isoform X2 [Corythoichthys intestinalis]|uniref:alpha-1A adrenergic receptor-like isoform X2 n=1 Tax=Corythoichthys intestinalis TaxID=161448 RepID=UPI0025A58C20|nr:alpha-1A adrenergic receptor-like isoform X2 [Corythoichthys intestinalis]